MRVERAREFLCRSLIKPVVYGEKISHLVHLGSPIPGLQNASLQDSQISSCRLHGVGHQSIKFPEPRLGAHQSIKTSGQSPPTPNLCRSTIGWLATPPCFSKFDQNCCCSGGDSSQVDINFE